jgi:hypothetical protein
MQLNSVSFTSTKIKVYNFDVFNLEKIKKWRFKYIYYNENNSNTNIENFPDLKAVQVKIKNKSCM